MNRLTRKKITHHLIEFFIIGLVMGITEDLLAIHLATDAEITPRVFLIAAFVALPFALISELLVDLHIFRRILFKKKRD